MNNNISYNQLNQNNLNNQYTEVSMKHTESKKTNKKIFLIGGIALAVVILIGIIVTLTLTKKNNPEKIAKNYVQSLIESNYEEAFTYIYLPEINFVNIEDFYDYIQSKEDYSKLPTLKITEIKEEYNSDNSGKYEVLLTNEEKRIYGLKLDLSKNHKDEWKIMENGLYLTDWSISTPGGTDLYIEGTKVNKTLITTEEDIKLTYVIPAIGQTVKKFKLDNPIESKEIEFTPTTSNSGEKIMIELTDTTLINKAYTYIKDTWNNMYKDYIDGVDISVIAEKYFDSSVTKEQINNYYTTGFNSITAGSSGYKNINFQMLEVVDNPNDSHYVVKEDVITINFGYKLSWQWSFTALGEENRIMTRYSKVRLKLNGDSFKLYQIPDEDLFSRANRYTQEY